MNLYVAEFKRGNAEGSETLLVPIATYTAYAKEAETRKKEMGDANRTIAPITPENKTNVDQLDLLTSEMNKVVLLFRESTEGSTQQTKLFQRMEEISKKAMLLITGELPKS